MKLSSNEIAAQVRSAVSGLRQVLLLSVSADKLDATIKEVIEEFTAISQELRPLARGEQCIVSLAKPRTAALLADRVWSTSYENDREFGFGLSVNMDVRFRTLLVVQNLFEAPPRSPGSPSGKLPPEQVRSALSGIERDLAQAFGESADAAVVPFYDSSVTRDLQYQPGNKAVILAIMDHLDIVDEAKLNWEQVNEFRHDKDARIAYRRFVHWLDREMVDRSASYIADELAGRLERYDWSLRKHGIERVVGALTTTLDVKNLLGSSSVGVGVEMITNSPIWSLCASGGLLIGRALLSLATSLIERHDLKLAQSEISYVAEVRQRLGQ